MGLGICNCLDWPISTQAAARTAKVG
jgi:hypothetical protein